MAVLLVGGKEHRIPLQRLPARVREGQVIDLDTLTVDAQATRAHVKRVKAQLARLRGKQQKPNPSGSGNDFDL